MKKLLTTLTLAATALTLVACSSQSSTSSSSNTSNTATTITSDNLQEQVQILQDKSDIRDLVDSFSTLADEKNAQAQGDLFTDDAQVIINNNGQETILSGKDQIVSTFDQVVNSMDSLYHMNGQVQISVDGDKATGTVYARVALVNSNDGRQTMTDEAVIYQDEYVKQDGKWLIAKRTSNFVFMDNQEMNGVN